SIPGYAIKVDRKNERVDSLYGIMIYDHTATNGVSRVILAKEGKMYKTNDGNYLVLKLKDGIRYEESAGNASYNPRQVFSRMRFKETEPRFDFSSFQMSRTDESSFSNVTEMLNLKGLRTKQDSLKKQLDSVDKYNKTSTESYFKQSNVSKGYTKVKVPAVNIKGNIAGYFPKADRLVVIQNGYNQANMINQTLTNQMLDHGIRSKEIIKTFVEYQRKFTLAASCLVLFFIGAPLGAIIRKGGLGLPVVISVLFFLIYHIITTVAEKSVKEGSLSVEFGMWLAVIILTPVGAFLTYKASADSALFDLDYYKQLILKRFRKKERVGDGDNPLP
ncbi:MAG: LptF/LptG family permease, partial [Chitinophagaceae bacterium]